MRDEVLRLNALMPHNGCRKIAATFCHLHRRRGETVGKSYVASVLRREGHRLAEIRRQLKKRRPRPLPQNQVWGLDLTQVRRRRKPKQILGLVDHGTRACLALRHLETKASVVIVRALLDIIERFGKPKAIRTDNEAVFTSRLFRLALWLLGIRHQRTAPFAPWQNGRIERFFGSFKAAWRRRRFETVDLQGDLDLFRAWYNHARPHENLGGLTPAMAWDGVERCRGKPWLIEAWDGELVGYVLPTR